MKKTIWKGLSPVTLLLLLTAQPLQANEILIGVKAGVEQIEFRDFSDEDPSAMASIQLGYEFLDLVLVDVAAELEFTTSMDEGKADTHDYNNQSTALFASARSAGPIYAIGRFGFVDTKIDFTDRADLDDNGSAYGLGIGFSTGIRFEIEFTKYDYDDIGDASYLSLGFSF